MADGEPTKARLFSGGEFFLGPAVCSATSAQLVAGKYRTELDDLLAVTAEVSE